MKILLKNARILKMDDTPIFYGDIAINDDKIYKIGTNLDNLLDYDYVRDCQGNVIMPSFKNAHAHSGMTFVRSSTDNLNLHDWLFNSVFPRENCLLEDDVYKFSKVAMLEYLSSGITASFDNYFFPPMIAKAAESIGIRVLILQDFSNHHIDSNLVRKCFHKYNDDKDSLVKMALGMHSEYTTNNEDIKLVASLCKEFKAPCFSHICETENEVKECYQRHSMSPVQYFYSNGCYEYGGGGFHCIYFNDEDIEIFKRQNLYVVTCPGSNCKLGSGIAPIRKYMDAGITIALGTDGPASNNCLDMFKEMMLVNHLAKVNEKDPTALSAYEVLKMATVNSAKAMGLNDVDVLQEGKKADIIEIDLSRPNMQPITNIINNIVYSGSKDNIKLTMVNGKILYKDHEFFLNESIEKIYKECQEATDNLEKRYLSVCQKL